MLSAADLEVNVLEFRQRSFQFDRLVELPDGTWAVFSRTETENERQLRPRLVRLTVAAPLDWVVLDAAADLLRLGPTPEGTAPEEASPTEVAAEPPEFEEHGHRWRRRPHGAGGYLYAPEERGATVDSPEGRAAFG